MIFAVSTSHPICRSDSMRAVMEKIPSDPVSGLSPPDLRPGNEIKERQKWWEISTPGRQKQHKQTVLRRSGTVAPAPCTTNVCVRELNAHCRKMRVDAACGNSEGPQKHGIVPVKRSRFKLDRVNSLILASTFCFTFKLFTSAHRSAAAMKFPKISGSSLNICILWNFHCKKKSPCQPQLLNLCFLLLFIFAFLDSFFNVAQNIATYILVLPSVSNTQAEIRSLSNHAHHIRFAPFLLPALESIISQTSPTASPTIREADAARFLSPLFFFLLSGLKSRT